MELCLSLSPVKLLCGDIAQCQDRICRTPGSRKIAQFRAKEQTGARTFQVSQCMDPCLLLFHLFPQQKAIGNKNTGFQKEVMCQHSLQERGLFLSLFLLRALGNPEIGAGLQNCMLFKPQQWKFNNEPLFKLCILQNNMQREITLSLTSAYTFIGLCNTHTHVYTCMYAHTHTYTKLVVNSLTQLLSYISSQRLQQLLCTIPH